MQTRCNVFILAHCALRTSKWGLFLGCDIWILMRTFHPRSRLSFPLPLPSLSLSPSSLLHFFPAHPSFPSFPLNSSFSSHSSATRETIVPFSVGIHLGNNRWISQPLVAIPKKDSSLADARKIFLWETFRIERFSHYESSFQYPQFLVSHKII